MHIFFILLGGLKQIVYICSIKTTILFCSTKRIIMAKGGERAKYALITALYNDKSRGLYSDIYYPIIKYAVIKIFNNDNTSEHFSTAEKVQEVIHQYFGITIPHAVITLSLKKIEAFQKGSIKLITYSDGSFKITDALMDEDENTFEEKEHIFNSKLKSIEVKFAEFIELEGLADIGTTFVQFMSDNTDSILGYLKDQMESENEAMSASVIHFLEKLREQDKELFSVANKLFWSSILAAFLQSETQVNSSADSSASEYYFDTSLVMGLLGLSNPETEKCAAEVRDVLKSAGCQIKVHPITLEEVKTIIEKAEQDSPKEGTPIASAYIRNRLTPTKLAQQRVELMRNIEKQGVLIFPTSLPNVRQNAMYEYRNKTCVKELAAQRSRHGEYDDFREVHDIYMEDYIHQQRKTKKGKSNIYFVTSNRDLIDYCCNTYHPGEHNMLSPRSVILDLWMHNTKPSDISSCMLTETMARCMDSHRIKVRSKIYDIAEYFKQAEIEFTPELYKDLLRNLYRRAKNIISVVEANPDDDPKVFMQNIKDALARDNAHFDSTISDMQKRNEELEKEAKDNAEAVKSLEEQTEKKSQEIGGLSERNDKLTKENHSLEIELKATRDENSDIKIKAEKESKEKEEAWKVVMKFHKRDELNNLIAQKQAELEPLEYKRKRETRYHTPGCLLTLGIISLSMSAVMLVLDKMSMINIVSWGIYVVMMVIPVSLICYSMSLNREENRERHINRYRQYWDSRHSEYIALRNEIKDLNDELVVLEREIKRIN